MATRIEKDYIFEAGMHFENAYQINSFELTLLMEVDTDDMHEQNIAIERLDHLVYTCLQNCVFVSMHEAEAIEKYRQAGIEVCTLNYEPYDQIIASTLMIKMNSIIEQKLSIQDMVFGSKLTGGIRFTFSFDEIPKDYFTKNWWTASNIRINDFEIKESNVVNLFNNDWATLELLWKPINS